MIAAVFSGKFPKTAGKRRGRPAKKAASSKKPAVASKKKRAARGSVQGKILKALKVAGDKGVKVVDLAKQLGVKGGGLHVWFSTTGKKHPIKKVGKGHYKLLAK